MYIYIYVYAIGHVGGRFMATHDYPCNISLCLKKASLSLLCITPVRSKQNTTPPNISSWIEESLGTTPNITPATPWSHLHCLSTLT